MSGAIPSTPSHALMAGDRYNFKICLHLFPGEAWPRQKCASDIAGMNSNLSYALTVVAKVLNGPVVRCNAPDRLFE